MKQVKFLLLFTAFFLASNSSSAQSIKKYTESASNFSRSPELSSNKYPDSVLYRAYDKGGTGFKQVEGLQSKLEKKIREFAKKRNKYFVILGQSLQNGGFGRFPKVEIIFALAEKS